MGNWYDRPSETQRPVSRRIKIGRMHVVTFRVPTGAYNSHQPARGTDVSAIPYFVKLGIVGITNFGARMSGCEIGRKYEDGTCDMDVTVIEPLAYS